MQCKVMSEIREIHMEIKWAQIESVIIRGRGIQHRHSSIEQQHRGTPLMVSLCQNEALTQSQQREEMQLYLCVYTAFRLQNSDARVLRSPPTCLYIPPAYLAPTPGALCSNFWMIEEFKKLWTFTWEGKGEALQSSWACQTWLKPKCNPAYLWWKSAPVLFIIGL